ncbi:hypothetical protein BJ944DRAFT_266536, partial [Cunninghamella echinulata]
TSIMGTRISSLLLRIIVLRRWRVVRLWARVTTAIVLRRWILGWVSRLLLLLLWRWILRWRITTIVLRTVISRIRHIYCIR